MKKIKMSAVALLLGGSLLFSSCIGSFGLFNKVLDWNKQVTGEKFVNELIFIGLNIIPVYSLCGFADLVVLNTIEFWSGSNPISSVGTVKHVQGENAAFAVTTTKDGYTVTNEQSQKSINFVFDEKQQCWSVVSDGVSNKIFKFNPDGTLCIYLQNGGTMNVANNPAGMMAARQAMMGDFVAMK